MQQSFYHCGPPPHYGHPFFGQQQPFYGPPAYPQPAFPPPTFQPPALLSLAHSSLVYPPPVYLPLVYHQPVYHQPVLRTPSEQKAYDDVARIWEKAPRNANATAQPYPNQQPVPTQQYPMYGEQPPAYGLGQQLAYDHQ